MNKQVKDLTVIFLLQYNFVAYFILLFVYNPLTVQKLVIKVALTLRTLVFLTESVLIFLKPVTHLQIVFHRL